MDSRVEYVSRILCKNILPTKNVSNSYVKRDKVY